MTEPSRGLCADDVIVTDELERRPPRAPDHEGENRALNELAEALAGAPDTVLQCLVEAAMRLTHSDSAGISLLEPGGTPGVFRWVATAGAWAPYRGGTMPSGESPCDEVIARDRLLLLTQPDRAFPALEQADPPIAEGLLTPFEIDGASAGTVWVIKHDPAGRFDAEDARLLQSLARFASAAVSAAQARKAAEAQRDVEAADRARAEAELRENEQRLAAELSRSRLLQRLSTCLIPEQSPEALYEQILDTALELMGADAVSIQLLEEDGQRLRRVATRNLHPDSTEYWTWVDASHASTCGQALAKNERVVVEDVEAAAELAGTGDLEAFRASGTRAVQSSPLLTRTGRPIGMISTHWREPRPFAESDFDLFDILARQVADLFERSRTEAVLRESEERLRRVLDGMGEGFGVIGPDFTVLEHNREALRMDGRPKAEIVGRSHWDAFPGTEHAEIGVLLKKAMADRQPALLEHRYAWEEGRALWLELRIYPMADGALAAFWRDVTARKAAEEALRESEQLRSVALAGGRMGTWKWDLARREVLGDAQFLKLWGFPPSDEPLPLSAFTDRQSAEGNAQTEGVVTKAIEAGEEFDAPIQVASGPTAGRWLRWQGRAAAEDPTILYGVSFDITEHVEVEAALRASEERQAFLLKLSDTLRPLLTAGEIKAAAAAAVGEWLGVASAGYAEIEADGLTAAITDEHNDGRVLSLKRRYALKDFGNINERMARGETIRVADRDEDELSPDVRGAYAAINVRAAVAVPLIKRGVMVAYLFVAHPEPRAWTESELAVLADVADRTWAAVERARAEAALRESEEKYRTLFQTMAQGYLLVEILRDDAGEVIDCRYLELNPAFERLTGLPMSESQGKTATELFGAVEDAWFEALDRVSRSGVPETIEQENASVGRWFEAHYYRQDDDLIIGFFEDISERKRAEAALRESEERQAFLLKLSDALRPVGDPIAIQEVATRVLGERLGAARVLYAEMAPDEENLVIHRDFTEGVASIAGSYRLSDFGTPTAATLKRGNILAIGDVRADPEMSDADRAAFDAIAVRAHLEIPSVKQGRLVSILGIHHAVAREWTQAEIALASETAERTWAAVERARAEAALRESEARHRFRVELGDALHGLASPSEIMATVAERLGPYLGVDQASYYEIEGERFIVTREWRTEAVPGVVGSHRLVDFGPSNEARLHAGEVIRLNDTHGVDGSEAFGSLNIAALLSVPLHRDGRWAAGLHVLQARPRAWTDDEEALVREVAAHTWAAVDRAKIEQALRESEERQRMMVELVPALLWSASPDGQHVGLNERWLAYTGQSEDDTRNYGWLDAIHPDDLPETRAAFERAFATGESLERQHRLHKANDGYRWHLVRHVPVRDAQGVITRWFGAAVDIHESKLAEQALQESADRQQVLVGELQHRTRNLMGVVRAMADRTIATSDNLPDFRTRFRDRLEALARVQGLLSRLEEHDRVTFDELIRTELAALHGESDKVTLEGPEGVRLRSSMVQTLAMALHELATNAVKYGALKQPDGHLTICWTLGSPDARGRPWLSIDWRESGVAMPPVEAAPQGSGQGRELIEQALPYQLGAKTSFAFEEDGVHCTISLPVSASNSVAEDAHG